MKAMVLLAIAVMLLCLAAGTAMAEGYTIVDLGTLPGDRSEAAAINGAGQIVGQSRYDASGHYHAYLWQEGTMVDLGALPGDSYSAAYGINGAGQIVGFSAEVLGREHACVWQSGTIAALEALPGGSARLATDINEAGQIVGYSVDGSGRLHACLWQDGAVADLGTLPGGGYSAAYGINEAGQIVGRSSYDASGRVHACLWQDGTIVDLGTLAGSIQSGAIDINDSGQIVGWSDDASGLYHACLWQDGTIVDLGALPGRGDGLAHGINEAGQIVGWYYDADGGNHAFLWQDGTVVDLGALPGGIGGVADDINDAGQIVGSSYDAAVHVRSCLWQPQAEVLPVADFAGVPTTGATPLSVQFTDLSTGDPTSWDWTFGDGATSPEQSPTHTYTAAGSYPVSLTATNAAGSDTETKPDYITVAPQTWFEDDDSAITYSGAWSTYLHPSASAGHAAYSSQTGASAEFTFTGTGIRCQLAKGPSMGKARVYLDGGPGLLVDLYSSTLQLTTLEKLGLPAGEHTVRMEVSGQKNRRSEGYVVDLDALEVVP